MAFDGFLNEENCIFDACVSAGSPNEVCQMGISIYDSEFDGYFLYNYQFGVYIMGIHPRNSYMFFPLFSSNDITEIRDPQLDRCLQWVREGEEIDTCIKATKQL